MTEEQEEEAVSLDEPLLSPVEVLNEEARAMLESQAKSMLKMLVKNVGVPTLSMRSLVLISDITAHYHEMLLDVVGGREPTHTKVTPSTVIETFGAQLLDRLGPLLERLAAPPAPGTRAPTRAPGAAGLLVGPVRHRAPAPAYTWNPTLDDIYAEEVLAEEAFPLESVLPWPPEGT